MRKISFLTLFVGTFAAIAMCFSFTSLSVQATSLPAPETDSFRTISDGGGDWNSSSTWVEGQVPTSINHVIATPTSGDVTISSTAYARSVDLSDYTGTITHNSFVEWRIGHASVGIDHKAVTFSEQMTYSIVPSSTIRFVSTSSLPQSIDFAGHTVGRVYLDGQDGSWKLVDNLVLTNSSILHLMQGTFDANGFDVDTGRFYSSTTASRTLLMGSGTWRINGHNSGQGKVWGTHNLSSLAVDPGTATVELTYTGSEGNRGIQTSCHPDVHWPDFNFTGGSDGLFITNMCNVNNVDFTGFSGTMIPDQFWSGPPHSFIMPEGDITLSPDMKFAPDFAGFFMHFIGPESKTLTANGLTEFPGYVRVSGGALTLADDLSITGYFIINGSDVTVHGNGRMISVGGDWVNNGGIFNPQGSTVVLTGTDQNVIGSTTFFNLFKDSSVTDTLTFSAGSTQTINGELRLNGIAGNVLSLRSSAPGNHWFVDPASGKYNLNYLDVQDSFNDNAFVIKAKNSVDSGNNHRWIF